MVTPINTNIAPILPNADIGGSNAAAPAKAFGDLVEGALKDTMQAQKTAQGLSEAVANGENIPMHKVVQAVAEAEVKLQTLVTVRDKAVQAYQQITQMPI